MTDTADRRWGLSQVRAPTAKDAAHPDGEAAPLAVVPAPPAPARLPCTPPPIANTAAIRPLTAAVPTPIPGPSSLVTAAVPTPIPGLLSPVTAAPTAWDPPSGAHAAVVALPPRVIPPAPRAQVAAPVPAPAVRPAPAPVSPIAPALRWPLSTSDEHDTGPVGPVGVVAEADPSLARLARGVQDCARALECLADRLDSVERRLDAGRPSAPADSRAPSGHPDSDDVEAMMRALEGLSADRIQVLDQRLRKLEVLPTAVGRLQKDTAWLADLATTRKALIPNPIMEPTADLAPVYQELNLVAERVLTHQATATQSLERVRTLERAVLEMRRHLERNLAEQSRVATSGQAVAATRVERLEARMAAMESFLAAPGASRTG